MGMVAVQCEVNAATQTQGQVFRNVYQESRQTGEAHVLPKTADAMAVAVFRNPLEATLHALPPSRYSHPSPAHTVTPGEY